MQRQLLDALVPEIQKTSQLVQEITSASVEQNAGAGLINSAILQLNAVTQQNAVSSGEMANSAEELSSQADSLRSAVSFFKLDDDRNVPKRTHHIQKSPTEHKQVKTAVQMAKKNSATKQDLLTPTVIDSDFESF